VKSVLKRISKMNSATRRHHYRRLQKTRKLYWFGHEIKHTPRQSGMVIATPCCCSNNCCGNPRKHFNQLTIQERRALSDEN